MDPSRLAALIVGSVMALGIVFSFWGAELARTRLNVSGAPEDVCIGAMFRLYSGNYDKEKKEMLLVLDNQRGVDLELKTLYLFYPNKEMKSFGLNEALQGNMLLSITVKGVEDDFESGTIKTNCPDVTVDFTYSDVT